jgi:hypothetical protein
MTNTERHQKRIERDTREFTKIGEVLTKELGYERMTREMKQQDIIRLGLKSAARTSLEASLDQVSYRKYEKGYTIHLHTTYDETTLHFADKGVITLMITHKDLEHSLSHRFQRSALVSEKVIPEMKIVANGFKNRPLCPISKRYMVLFQDYDKGTVQWVSPLYPEITKNFYAKLPKELMEYANESREWRHYYRTVGKVKKGVQNSLRDIRRKKRILAWQVTNPQNAE